MSIIDSLLTDVHYEHLPYSPWGGFNTIESDICSAYPEKYTIINVQDSRFVNPSWINIHSWSTSYLALWSIKPTQDHYTITKYLVSLSFKPLAALFDTTVNTMLVPAKLLVLLDRILVVTAKTAFHLHHNPNDLTIRKSGYEFGNQLGYMLSSLLELVLQPINILPNMITPKWDLFLHTKSLVWSYTIVNKEGEIELILDQGRVKYLREKCGWEHVTDEAFKALSNSFSSSLHHYVLSYFEQDGKLCIKANWEDEIQVGNIRIPIFREDRNY